MKRRIKCTHGDCPHKMELAVANCCGVLEYRCKSGHIQQMSDSTAFQSAARVAKRLFAGYTPVKFVFGEKAATAIIKKMNPEVRREVSISLTEFTFA